jgi:MerR family transcriptional regulator/heat shock protein HspR
MRRRKKGYLSISAVAQMFSIHPQTIRLYEQEGLISPRRTEGNARLFSEEDLDKIEEIVYLTHNLGINLAGVEMILKLKRQMKKMQKEMNGLFKQVNQELNEQETISKLMVKESASRLMHMKNRQPSNAAENHTKEQPVDWEIDYDE